MIRRVLLMLCLSLSQLLTAQTADDIRQLERDMYRYYSTDNTKEFLHAVSALKTACQKTGDEQTFYKAWGNEAIYTFNRISRNSGVQIARQIHDYAEAHDSKFGLYTATYVTGTVLSGLGLKDGAESNYLEAVEYQHRYFPASSAAAPYLGLAKIEYNRGHIEKVVEYADKALAEPKVIMQHQVTAWTYKCLAYGNMNKPQEFNHAFAEREKVKEKYGHGDNFDSLVLIYQAMLADDLDKALELSKAQKAQSSRLEQTSRVYARMGKFKEAYYWYMDYKRYADSVNTAELRQQSYEYASQLDVARVENEAKDLRLANQTLRLMQISTQLEQKQLQEDTLNLALKNRDMALANAAAKLRNDSLESYNKDLQLREYKLSMEAEKNSSRLRRNRQWLVGLLVALSFTYLVFYVHRRRQQLRLLREAYDQLEQTTSVKERIESELRIAHDIQMSMVPSVFPAYPERGDIDLYATMVPARAVGGDLYDFYLHDERLYFCVGDVSGKGVSASMLMAVAVNLFRTMVKEGYSPVAIATKMNGTLSADNSRGVFITMFIGEINLETGQMDYCNAGHNPPLFGDSFLSLHETNGPLGLWPELKFVGERVDNVKGKPLLIYTDGLTEAENAAQEQFGEERLLTVVRDHPFETSRKRVALLREEVNTHVGEASQSDDLTMLCVMIHERKLRRELTIRNDLKELDRVRLFIEEIAQELKLDSELEMNLQLVMDEMVSNIIFYAYPKGETAEIHLIADSDGQELTFLLSDEGCEFDPTLKGDVDINKNLMDRKTGGLGIFIVKNIMNEVTYQRRGSRNLVILKKIIQTK